MVPGCTIDNNRMVILGFCKYTAMRHDINFYTLIFLFLHGSHLGVPRLPKRLFPNFVPSRL